MISPDSFFTSMDPESRRKRALASVYDFLLKLAEEKKNPTEIQTLANDKEDSAPLKSNIPS
jgi:hypothetical protein